MGIGKLLRAGLLLSCGCLGAFSGYGQDAKAPEAKPSKYPLRLHVLAVDDTFRTVRMQPNWCSGQMPDMGGGDAGGAGGGGTGSPCTNGAGTLSFGGDDDFSGAGRGDLVSPPTTTQGLSFRYEGCGRVRVSPGFQGLAARWKKPGKKLEVLIPADDLAGRDRAVTMQKCTLTAALNDFVYLRVGSGKLLKVSQEAYWKKPALRAFLSGGPAETLQPRVPVSVSVKQLMKPAANVH